ncbi:MAG: hypothetical protein FWC15_06730 [Fibromonadales bacterium]|nr:hypothetical protein [Fibromonadales bacterium]
MKLNVMAKFFAFSMAASLLLWGCSMPSWVPFFGEEESEDEGETYFFCVYVSLNQCFVGPFKTCTGDGIPSNTCPPSYQGGGNINPGISSSSNINPGISSANNSNYYSSSSYSSSSIGSNVNPGTSSANNSNYYSSSSAQQQTTQYYCDWGYPSTAGEGGCYPIEASERTDCTASTGKVVTSCGGYNFKYCNWGPSYNEPSDPNCDGYCGGCHKIGNGITEYSCENDWGSVVDECPSYSLVKYNFAYCVSSSRGDCVPVGHLVKNYAYDYYSNPCSYLSWSTTQSTSCPSNYIVNYY